MPFSSSTEPNEDGADHDESKQMDLRIMNVWKWIAVAGLGLLPMGVTPPPANAQLNNELEELFEGMLGELSPSVRKKFEAAIANKTNSIEFEKDEFRRFRANPVNPFDGMDGIKPEKLNGTIILKFELPSLRTRRIDRFERQHPSQLYAFQPAVKQTAKSVVKLIENSKQIALGTITESGIITKASEIKNRDEVYCVFYNGVISKVQIRSIDIANDVALLEIDSRSSGRPSALRRYGIPVKLSEKQLSTGAFVISPNERGKVFSVGTYSTGPRSTTLGKRAFLGVQPKSVPSGIYVEQITPDTAAAAAGLQNGDVITRLDGLKMHDVGDFVNQIRKHQPGDSIEIEYVRDNTNGTTVAQLSSLHFSGRQAAQFKMMNRLGAVPSRRNDNFPYVFQHDMPLFPEQCGGPIVDLDGKVVGINIARNGRASTFAIPSSHLKTILKRLTASAISAGK